MREENAELRRRAETEAAELREKYQQEIAKLEQLSVAESAKVGEMHEESERRAKDMEDRAKDIQQLLRDESERCTETKRALQAANDQVEEIKKEKETLEKLIASWTSEKGDLQSRLDVVNGDLNETQMQVTRLETEKNRMEHSLTTEISQLESLVESLKEKSAREEWRRRQLFEQVQNLRGNIRVMCRVRPPSADTPDDEIVDFHPTAGELSDHYQNVEVLTEEVRADGTTRVTNKNFSFERVFTVEHTNNDVFGEIGQVTMSAIDGKKVCVFCYGQTGSGKTFTMNHKVKPGHDDPNDGILHRAVALMFENFLERKEHYEYKLQLAVAEVYLKDLFDLCDGKGLKVIDRMEDATLLDLDTKEAVNRLIEKSLGSRRVGATKANAVSSRSHLILRFKITQTELKGPRKGKTSTGFLNLIDLAGSERLKDTGIDPNKKGITPKEKKEHEERFAESTMINSSLMDLNQTIKSQVTGEFFKPRHTLARVLQPCITQGSRVVMFVMVSPLKKDQRETETTMNKATIVSPPNLLYAI